MIVERWYLCHPYSGDTIKRFNEILEIRDKIYLNPEYSNVLLIIPQLATIGGQELYGREKAMLDCVGLLKLCDRLIHIVEVKEFSEGMELERKFCIKQNIPITKLDITIEGIKKCEISFKII